MPGEYEHDAPSGWSRRQLLARGAVAAGVVWAAPVIRSTAAYATTNNGTERPCINFYFVVIKPTGKCRPPIIPKGLPGYDGDARPVFTDPDTGEDLLHGVDRLPPAIEQWLRDNPDVDLQFPSICPQLTQTSDHAWAILLPETVGPNAAGRQCRMVIGWSRKSSSYKENTFAEGYVDPNPPIAVDVGRRLIFPCPPLVPDHAGDEGSLSSDGAPSIADTLSPDGAPAVPPDPAPAADPTTTSTTTTTTTTPPSAPAPEGLSADGALASSGFTASGGVSGDGGSGGASDGGLSTGGSSVSGGGGVSGGGLSGDGGVSGDDRVGSDGRPSTNQKTGPGRCISAVYLIYCCPR